MKYPVGFQSFEKIIERGFTCKLSGLEPQAESHSYRRRSDTEVITQDYIYVFEFKYDRSVREAMDQLS